MLKACIYDSFSKIYKDYIYTHCPTSTLFAAFAITIPESLCVCIFISKSLRLVRYEIFSSIWCSFIMLIVSRYAKHKSLFKMTTWLLRHSHCLSKWKISPVLLNSEFFQAVLKPQLYRLYHNITSIYRSTLLTPYPKEFPKFFIIVLLHIIIKMEDLKRYIFYIVLLFCL